ncbi:hypothetical protein [Streptomyces sp. HD]|uniref:hypothetical protein n=1 Tax=Streptomyces sp. HD TaxID=3020892 RepID=UPI00232B83BF|nr:hypothetical protein [Streptomyces sp. HD]MDC0770212.1 hypothetical protein [Streptomyces sp. HD]
MIERLCNQEGSLTGVYGALNVDTGEFKTQDEYLRDVFGLWKPAGPWELFRVNPVFQIEDYQWNKGDGDVTAHTWRGRDASWKTIYSYGYYIEGVSDKVLPGGQPDGREDKIEEKPDPGTCTN